MQNRQNALNQWLEKVLDPSSFSINALASDASFRRYFRLYQDNDNTRIIMDAPPDKEAIEPFILVTKLLHDAGISSPQLHRVDKEQGFAILDDFGDTLFLSQLSPNNSDNFYIAAIDTLIKMQQIPTAKTTILPCFDKKFIWHELEIFKEWFLQSYLKIQLTAEEEVLLNETFDWLCQQIKQQPQVFIHRDYHSRNIMLLKKSENIELGIIDFQDAMRGPLTYDVVSLLKDCYIQWPQDRVMGWFSYFYEQSAAAQRYSLPDITRAFDCCGIQRHLKVLGVFARLYLRDNKPCYLQNLPLTLHYIMACLEGYEELEGFYQFLNNRIHLP